MEVEGQWACCSENIRRRVVAELIDAEALNGVVGKHQCKCGTGKIGSPFDPEYQDKSDQSQCGRKQLRRPERSSRRKRTEMSFRGEHHPKYAICRLTKAATGQKTAAKSRDRHAEQQEAWKTDVADNKKFQVLSDHIPIRGKQSQNDAAGRRKPTDAERAMLQKMRNNSPQPTSPTTKIR